MEVTVKLPKYVEFPFKDLDSGRLFMWVGHESELCIKTGDRDYWVLVVGFNDKHPSYSGRHPMEKVSELDAPVQVIKLEGIVISKVLDT